MMVGYANRARGATTALPSRRASVGLRQLVDEPLPGGDRRVAGDLARCEGELCGFVGLALPELAHDDRIPRAGHRCRTRRCASSTTPATRCRLARSGP